MTRISAGRPLNYPPTTFRITPSSNISRTPRIRPTRVLRFRRANTVCSMRRAHAANHHYDLNDFFDALKATIPAGGQLHQSSRPRTVMPDTPIRCWSNNGWSPINAVQQSKLWSGTAIIITWDDSDGWYDHVMAQSSIPQRGRPASGNQRRENSDQLNGPASAVMARRWTVLRAVAATARDPDAGDLAVREEELRR